jgi:hypothetical protein
LSIHRTIAPRYDQLALSFLGMMHLAIARYWLELFHAAWCHLDLKTPRDQRFPKPLTPF